jgi:hypothetical protein
MFASVAMLSLALVLVKATAGSALETWSPPRSTGYDLISAVSCVNTNFCAAVGGAEAVTYNGTSWSVPADIDPTPPNNNGFNFLDSVSCASPSFCAAVDDQGDALIYSGGTWSAPTPLDANTDLLAVSCPSPSFCMTEGITDLYSGGVLTGVIATAFTFNGTSWSAPMSIPMTGAGRGLSCLSANFCVIASLGDAAEIYNGTSWSETIIASPVNEPQSVSCPTVTFCVAVDDNGIASIYNGTSWSPSSVDGAVELHSVSCPSPSFCVAVDDHGSALTYNGTSWSAPDDIDGTGPLESVSCPSASFCVAIGDGGFALISNDADLALTNAPTNQIVNATSPSGAAVDYTVPTATDPDDTALSAPSCSPASGSIFAIGTTTVTCSVNDPDDGNSPVSVSFAVVVLGAAAQEANLQTSVTGVGPGTSLSDKLRQAQTDLATNSAQDGCAVLKAFISEVTAQSGRPSLRGMANQLVASATRIENVLSC